MDADYIVHSAVWPERAVTDGIPILHRVKMFGFASTNTTVDASPESMRKSFAKAKLTRPFRIMIAIWMR